MDYSPAEQRPADAALVGLQSATRDLVADVWLHFSTSRNRADAVARTNRLLKNLQSLTRGHLVNVVPMSAKRVRVGLLGLQGAPLESIFEHLDLLDRIALSQASRSLRNFACTTPRIWNSACLHAQDWLSWRIGFLHGLRSDNNQLPERWRALSHIIGLGTSLNLDICEDIPDQLSPYPAMTEFFKNSWAKARSLSACISVGYDGGGHFLQHALTHMAPQLETLCLSIRPSVPDTTSVIPAAETCFGGAATRLTALLLSGACLPDSPIPIAAFAHVRVFDYMPFGLGLGRYMMLSTADLLHIFACMPRVEILGLSASHFIISDNVHVNLPRSLSKVALAVEGWSEHRAAAREALQFFHGRGVRFLALCTMHPPVRLPHEPPLGRVWHLPPPFDQCTRMSLLHHRAILHCDSREGVESELHLLLDDCIDALRDEALYAQLTHLTISAETWPRFTKEPHEIDSSSESDALLLPHLSGLDPAHALPSTPELLRLRVLIPACGPIPREIFEHGEAAYMDAPKLAALTISRLPHGGQDMRCPHVHPPGVCQSCSSSSVMSSGVLLSFVNKTLRLREDALAALEIGLEGLHIAADDDKSHFGQLCTSLHPSSFPPKYYLQDHSGWMRLANRAPVVAFEPAFDRSGTAPKEAGSPCACSRLALASGTIDEHGDVCMWCVCTWDRLTPTSVLPV